jgi:hypothetical protein
MASMHASVIRSFASLSAHLSVIKFGDKLGDSLIESVEREECLMANLRNYPSLRNQHTTFDFRLIARTFRTRGKHSRRVVARHLFVRALNLRLVAARERHAAFQLIGHDRFGNAAHVLEGAHVTADPVPHRLRTRRFRIDEIRCAKHGDEEFDFGNLTGRRIDNAQFLSRVIDEEFLSGAMILAHRRPLRGKPRLVMAAKCRVAKAVRMLLEHA